MYIPPLPTFFIKVDSNYSFTKSDNRREGCIKHIQTEQYLWKQLEEICTKNTFSSFHITQKMLYHAVYSGRSDARESKVNQTFTNTIHPNDVEKMLQWGIAC